MEESIIITSNKSFSIWVEIMRDEVVTVVMLTRLLHHANIFTLEGESYRLLKRKEVEPSRGMRILFSIGM